MWNLTVFKAPSQSNYLRNRKGPGNCFAPIPKDCIEKDFPTVRSVPQQSPLTETPAAASGLQMPHREGKAVGLCEGQASAGVTKGQTATDCALRPGL